MKRIIQTNIFLNCPVVPNGSTVDPGSHQPEPAFFEGELVTIVPYDIEDGEDNVQVLFKFEDQDGNTLGRTRDTGVSAKSLNGDQNFIPHIVTSHAIGDPFYTSLWDVWTVVVPNGTDVSSIRSTAAVKAGANAGLYKIHSAGFQLDCPVVSIDGVPVRVEDVFDLMGGRTRRGENVCDSSRVQFGDLERARLGELRRRDVNWKAILPEDVVGA